MVSGSRPNGSTESSPGLRPQADALGTRTSTNWRPERGAGDYHITGLDQITSERPFRKAPAPFQGAAPILVLGPRASAIAASALGWVLAAPWAARRLRPQLEMEILEYA